MLEKPDIQDQTILSTLYEAYGLRVVALDFLPLGADRNTAAYRAVAADGRTYFVKVRRGAFDETAVGLPRFLSDHGIEHIIAPLESREGDLWAGLDAFKLILYPFIEGQSGYEVTLSQRQWHDLGRALREIHTTQLPAALRRRIRRETFSPRWGTVLRTFLACAHDTTPADPISAELARFLRTKSDPILDLMRRFERLIQPLQARALAFVLCHSDIHAGNVLIEPDGALHVVDWDEPILAPKERDLMFIGTGYWGNGYTSQEEEAFFYRGYGRTQVDPFAMAYYRYGRIVEDIAVFCDRIFQAHEGREDREQSLRYLQSNFLPRNTIEMAYATDETLLDA